MLGLGSPKRPSVSHSESGSGHGGCGRAARPGGDGRSRQEGTRGVGPPPAERRSEGRTVVVGAPEVRPVPATPQHHPAVEPAGDDRRGSGG